MFNESMIESGGKRKATQKWLTFPISLIVHVIVIGSVVVLPLMTADSDLPEVKIFNVFMAAPPPPPPPPPPPAKKKSTRKAKKKDEKKEEVKRQPIIAGRLVAPIEVPEEIEEEDVSDFGFDGGVDGGVEGGVEGGVIGGVLGGLGDPSQVTEAIRVASIQRPRLIRRIEPKYPEVALRARIQGRVIIEATTDIYGRVKSARVVSGHPLLNQPAMNAIKKWVYEPYVLNGIPKPVRFTVIITFNLQGQ